MSDSVDLRVLGTAELRRRTSDGSEVLSVRPKEFALLVYLSLAGTDGRQRRDTLISVFWPEIGQQRARHSLRQALYRLRQVVGSEAIQSRGKADVALAGGGVRCDAVEFERALDENRLEDALELYEGELLPAFHIDAPEWMQWADAERERLRGRAAEAARVLAERCEDRGDPAGAVRWARRVIDLRPYNERAVRLLVRLLEAVGDRPGAVRAYERFAERLSTDLELEPSDETRALIASLREGGGGAEAGEAPPAARPADDAVEPQRPAKARDRAGVAGAGADGGRRTRRLHWAVGLAGAALALMAYLFFTDRILPSPEAAPVIAVGEIDVSSATVDTAEAGPTLAGMLATNLARVPELRVISSSRLHEIRGARRAGGKRVTISRAAREAGAGQIVTGTLYDRTDGLRLDLRRVDLESGIVQSTHRVEGDNPFTLVDRATARLVSEFALRAPTSGVADVTTPSLVAYRFYEEGVRAYYEGDTRTARRLFGAALVEDSTFAMAWYYRARTHEYVDHAAFRADLGQAARFADRASDRERLLIRAAWAQEMDEPRQLALADTLAIRYPTEPDGHLFLGKARLWSGSFREALPHLRRVVGMGSAGADVGDPRCRACDARRDIVRTYSLMDSLPAAERAARRWVAEDSASARAWRALASTLEYQGRGEEAVAARRRAASLASGNPRDPVYPAVVAIRAGRFDRAEQLLADQNVQEGSLVQQNVLWYRTLILRLQGRLAEALDVARRYRDAVRAADVSAQRKPWESVLVAQVLLEMGRADEAAALWRRMSEYPYEPASDPRTARHGAWTLTQAAAAHAVAGDTGALPALADTIQTLGRKSAYGRDPRLHHYVRGLLQLARGDSVDAAQQFRRAIFSTTAGYGRINLALGRLLTALGRPEEAAEVLGGALRGPLDAGNLYVNRTDLHRALARAWRDAGMPDSAAVHARWVARAEG